MVNAHTCKLAVCWDPLCFFFIQALQTGCCTCQHLNTWQVKQNFKNNLNIPDLVCPDCIKGAPCSFEEDILVRRESSLLPDLFFIYLDQPDLKVLLCLYSGGLVLDWEHLFYSIMENNNNNKKNNLSLCNFPINIVNIKILISKCLLQKHAVCRLLNMCLSLFLTPQPFAWLPQFDSVFPLNTSPCQDATPWPFSCEWRQLCFLWTFLAFPFINWWILPGKLTNYMHNLLHKTWNLPTSSSFFFSSSGRQIETQPVERDQDDEISMAAVMVLRERTVLVISGFRSVPSPSGHRAAKRNHQEAIWLRRGVWLRLHPPRDWVSPFSWSKVDGQTVFPIFAETFMHHNWEPSGKGT